MRMSSGLEGDERSVSTTLSYSLNLAIAAILVSGLLFAAGGTVQDQRQVATREELRVIGERIAAALQQSDRLIEGGDNPELDLDVLAPRSVAGSQYTIALNRTGNNTLILETENPDILVEIQIQAETSFADSEIRGGELVIVYDDDDDELEVRVR